MTALAAAMSAMLTRNRTGGGGGAGLAKGARCARAGVQDVARAMNVAADKDLRIMVLVSMAAALRPHLSAQS